MFPSQLSQSLSFSVSPSSFASPFEFTSWKEPGHANSLMSTKCHTPLEGYHTYLCHMVTTWSRWVPGRTIILKNIIIQI